VSVPLIQNPYGQDDAKLLFAKVKMTSPLPYEVYESIDAIVDTVAVRIVPAWLAADTARPIARTRLKKHRIDIS
jgi:hypothetical protein